MQLFYTNSVLNAAGAAKTSLGGYISGTLIPNKIGNVFSAIYEAATENAINCKAIIVKNESNVNVSNPSIYIVNPSNYATYQVAVVTLVNNNQMEAIESENDLPVYATFYDVNCSYATTKLEVLKGATIDQVLTVDNVSMPISAGSSIENIRDTIYQYIRQNGFYNLTKLNTDSIILAYTTFGINTNQLIWSSTGDISLSIPAFSGGQDNSMKIASSMASGECLGIWVKRETDIHKKTPDELYANFVANGSYNFKKSIEKFELGILYA